jgi:cation diffusion facilitator family transporter
MQQEKESVALTSIAASGALTLAKAAVGIGSGSLAILSEAAHSLIDFAATVMTYFAVRLSGKPADEAHHYGHGKIESIAAFAETALLFMLSLAVIWEAARRLITGEGHGVTATVLAFAVMAGSVVVDFFRARALNRVAEKTDSEALEADALHFSSDMWSSLAVLVGLGGVYLGYSWADSAAAMIVAGFVLLAGWRLGARTISTLTDEAPEGVAEQIKGIVKRISGVAEVERVRVRRAGPVLFIDLALAVSRTLPLDRVEELKSDTAAAIDRELPTAEVVVTTNPRALDDETVLERVLVIARNRGLAVHHVTVHTVGEKRAVSLDLEVDAALTLAEAHEIADGLEEAINAELGPQVEVETHIEPLQIADAAGRDAGPERIRAVQETLAEAATRLGPLRDVHDVRVRETADGEIVNFHCRVDPSLTVGTVHDYVDGVERALKDRWPLIKRVIGHAEPGL